MRSIRVTADIRYLDGVLAGLEIPDGYSVAYMSVYDATKTAKWIESVRAKEDFVRATGTGNRYVFTSRPTITESMPG